MNKKSVSYITSGHFFSYFCQGALMGQEYLPNRVGTASGVTLGLALPKTEEAVPNNIAKEE